MSEGVDALDGFVARLRGEVGNLSEMAEGRREMAGVSDVLLFVPVSVRACGFGGNVVVVCASAVWREYCE